MPIPDGIRTPDTYIDVNLNAQRTGLPANVHKVLFITEDSAIAESTSPLNIYDKAGADAIYGEGSITGRMITAAIKVNRVVSVQSLGKFRAPPIIPTEPNIQWCFIDDATVFSDNLEVIPMSYMKSRNLDKLWIKDGVQVISDEAFNDNSITTLNLSDTVELIGQNSFSDNIIETLVLGSNVKMLGNYAFARNRLRSVSIHALIPPEIYSLTYPPFFGNPNIEEILVPSTAIDTYKSAEYWSSFSDLIKSL